MPNANGLFAQEDAILEIDACEFTAYGSAGLRTSTASCIGGLGRTLCFGGGFDGTGNVVPGPGEVNGNLATTLCTPPLTLWPPGLVKRE